MVRSAVTLQMMFMYNHTCGIDYNNTCDVDHISCPCFSFSVGAPAVVYSSTANDAALHIARPLSMDLRCLMSLGKPDI